MFIAQTFFAQNLYAVSFSDLNRLAQESENKSTESSNQSDDPIADLLEKIPDIKKIRYVMANNSRSTQSSKMGPRIVAYDLASKFAFAFNSGHKDESNANTIETMEYNPKRGFIFREISFSDKKPKVSRENPTKCMRCHVTDVTQHALWEAYFVWPGFVGAMDDKWTPKEQEYVKKFNAVRVKKTKDAPGARRYATLPEFKSSQNNTAFGIFLTELNNDKIVREIMENPKIKPFHFALMHALLCRNNEATDAELLAAITSGLPTEARNFLEKKGTFPDILRDTLTRTRADFLGRTQIVKAELGLTDADETRADRNIKRFKEGSKNNRKALAGGERSLEFNAILRYFVEGVGMDMSGWPMSASKGTYSFNDGEVFGTLFTKLTSALTGALMETYAKGSKKQPPVDASKECDHLQALSLKTLNKAISEGCLPSEKQSQKASQNSGEESKCEILTQNAPMKTSKKRKIRVFDHLPEL